MDYNLEITKILAKIMNNSYKRKEISEITFRIIDKMESVIDSSNMDDEFNKLKEEFISLKSDLSKYL
jgi:hypothetical protein